MKHCWLRNRKYALLPGKNRERKNEAWAAAWVWGSGEWEAEAWPRGRWIQDPPMRPNMDTNRSADIQVLYLLCNRHKQVSCTFPLPNLSFFLIFLLCNSLSVSFADPDPYVVGPPGPGSISMRYGSGSGTLYHQAKTVRKTLIPDVLLLFLWLFIFEN